MVIVTFISGHEREYDADSANVVEHLFVLYKYNPSRRKLESKETFPAEQVERARLPNGDIVVGRGGVRSQ